MDIFRPAEVRPFRYWCQKVLPLVYDDSLSYYELLGKVVKYLNDMADTMNANTEQLEKLISAVTSLYSKNYVREVVEKIIDKMVEDGTFDEIIEEVMLNFRTYKGSDRGWVVEKNGDSIEMSQAFAITTPVTEHLSGTEIVIYGTGNMVTYPLEMPITNGVVVGNADSYHSYVSNARVVNGCAVQFTPVILDSAAWESNNDVRLLMSVLAKGVHKAPRETPKFPVSANRSQVIALADSYYQSVSRGRKWAYGPNFVTYANSNVVNDDNGYGKMECDTFVALVMLGVPYESSPYADETAGRTQEFDSMSINPNNYSWVLPWRYNDIFKRKVTWTGGENWWLWYNDMVFDNEWNAENGDIVIFKKATSKYFDNIYHIGILNYETVNGVRTPYLYHFTASNVVPTPMRYEPLADVISRGNYDENRDVYFARPNYNA